MALLPYYDFKKPFSLVDKDFFRPNDLFYSPFNDLVGRDFFEPTRTYRPWSVFRDWEKDFWPLDNWSSTMSRLRAAADVGTKITADNEKFRVDVDVQHFAPEEVKVKVTNRDIIIQGRHQEKRDPHGYVTREFVRKYTLPDGCLPSSVQSNLSSDGVLTVTAPKKLALPSIGERIVPITHTGPIKRRLSFYDNYAITAN